jgi:predicted TIM-barrel fold metal-dependent hydrolase
LEKGGRDLLQGKAFLIESSPMEIPVIDSHVHVQPWKMIKPDVLAMMQGKRPDLDRINGMMYDPDRFVAYMDEERIETVISINYPSPDIMGFTGKAIDYAADFSKRSGGRVLAIGSVHPTMEKDPEGAMNRMIDDGFRGIKMHPSHQACAPNDYVNGNRVLETAYRKAQEAGMVLMVHTGTSVFPGARNRFADPILCDDIAIDFPDLKIILAHGGRPLWMPTAIFLVRRFPNVYMDVSSIPPQKLTEYFPRLETMADKILWGSDWPAPGVPGMRENVDRFLELPISDEAKRKIVHDNARKLYGL